MTPNPTPACSPDTARALYDRLAYYRHYMPILAGMTEAQYAARTEGRSADSALEAYRAETGAKDDYKDLPQ